MSELCANPKCGHPAPHHHAGKGYCYYPHSPCPCTSYVPPQTAVLATEETDATATPSAAPPQTAARTGFMRQVPGSLSCVRCDWRVPQGLSSDEENKALHEHLDAAHPNWQSDGITKSLHAELPTAAPVAPSRPIAPLEMMKAHLQLDYPGIYASVDSERGGSWTNILWNGKRMIRGFGEDDTWAALYADSLLRDLRQNGGMALPYHVAVCVVEALKAACEDLIRERGQASRQTREDGIRECLAIVQHYRYEDHEIRRLDWIEDSIKALLPPPKEGGKA